MAVIAGCCSRIYLKTEYMSKFDKHRDAVKRCLFGSLNYAFRMDQDEGGYFYVVFANRMPLLPS